MTSAVAIAVSAPVARRDRQRLIEKLAGCSFAFPAFLLLLLTNLVPLGVLIYLSFTNYELGALDTRFLGLDNFRKALTDPVLRRSLANVNGVLRAMGFGEIAFLSEPAYVLPTLAAIGIWQLVGFNMVLFLAGLSAIPRDLYEAAEIDGCRSGIDRFLTITWPLLGPTTMFVIITTSITAFKVFDTVAVMTRGGPMGSSEVLLYAIYLEGYQYFHMGYAAALTLIFLAFVLLFSILQTLVLERRVHY